MIITTTAAKLEPGDILSTNGLRVTLKRDNPYGMPQQDMTVIAVTFKGGYVTPWIHTALGAFRPKDLAVT